MITVQEEDGIRNMIPYMNRFQILKETRISNTSIASIKKMMDVCSKLPKKQLKIIQELLLLKIPVEAIVIKTQVNKEKVMAVKRYYYLQRREIQDGCRCPTCGRTDLACVKEIMEKINGEN